MYKEQLSSVEDVVFGLVADEFIRARKFKPFNSEHEGYAVILEEMDELWDGIKNNKRTTQLERMEEAVQIAAMAVKYVTSLADYETLDNMDLSE